MRLICLVGGLSLGTLAVPVKAHLDDVPATRLTDKKTFANNPAMAVSGQGHVWVTPGTGPL
ncbi:MAG: hypothetical protein WBF93_14165 [Pirellulales bacterium]